MKKLIALAVIALALPITVSAASAVKEHQTIPSLLSGRVTVEGQQTTGFAMENPEVWYEEPVEIADNSDSSSNSSSTGSSDSNSGSNESYSEPVAEEPTPEPTPTPAPEPVGPIKVAENITLIDSMYYCGCGNAFGTQEEAQACSDSHSGCDWCDYLWGTSEEMVQHFCQAHGVHLAGGNTRICEYCGNTIGADGGVINQESDLPFLEDE